MDTPLRPNRGLFALAMVGILLAVAGAVWLVLLVSSANDGDNDTVTAASSVVTPTSAAPTATVAATPSAVPTSAAPTATVAATPSAVPTAPTATVAATPSAVPTATPTAVATATPGAAAVVQRVLLEFDLETGSTEFSAVALNEDAGRLMIADDGNQLFEFDLESDGSLVIPPRRSIRVAVGAGDIEGIAWMTGTTYVLAQENDGTLMVVEFGEAVTTIGDEHVRRTIDTGIREIDGNGLEGVAYLGSGSVAEFVVVDERPPTLVWIDGDGAVIRSLLLDIGLTDVSDITRAPAGMLSVVSDEGRAVVDLSIDEDQNVVVHGTTDLAFDGGRFEQPEGVVRSSDGDAMYVVGEMPGPAQFVFGRWLAE